MEGRVLVVKLSSLGDALHALPAVAEIRDALGVPVDWAVQPQFAGLVSLFSCVDRVVTVSRPSSPVQWLRDVRRLRAGGRYSLVVDFQGLLKSAAVARAARREKGARVVGPPFSREGSRFFYTEKPLPPFSPRRHAVDECLAVLPVLGIPVPDVPRFPLRVPETDLAALAPELASLGGPAVAVAPFSRWESKNWPAERFAEAIRIIVRESDARVFVVGGPGDRAGAG
ncbi:MAG: glycosyltransferase family 9 protein, partial [Kiritimatiellae bacterium]|nr:glycosyltransferase family 9 protein [Kiritimatiellia bacterium]